MPACPRDLTNLRKRRVAGMEVLHCDQCRGLWLPSRVVTELVGKVRLARPTLTGAVPLLCPADKSRLARLHAHGVEIDVCPDCNGVWLDRGELERIQSRQFVQKAAGCTRRQRVHHHSSGMEFTGELLLGVLEFVVEALLSF